MNDVHPPQDPLPALSPPLTEPDRHSRLRRIALVIAVLLALALLAWLLTPKATKAPGGRFANGGPMPVVAAAGACRGHAHHPDRTWGGDADRDRHRAVAGRRADHQGAVQGRAEREARATRCSRSTPGPSRLPSSRRRARSPATRRCLPTPARTLNAIRPSLREDSIAEQTLATQKSLVLQDEGTVKTDQAQVDTARLNLSYAHVVSPIAGRAGLQQVNLGNYITPAEPNGLVVVAQLKPITVVFSLPEDQIPAAPAAAACRQHAARDRLRPHQHHQACQRHPAVDRQPDRRHDRDAEDEGELRQRGGGPVPAAVRQHRAAAEHAARGHARARRRPCSAAPPAPTCTWSTTAR